jgi:hypothetical protein
MLQNVIWDLGSCGSLMWFWVHMVEEIEKEKEGQWAQEREIKVI